MWEGGGGWWGKGNKQMTTHAPGKKTFLFHMILGSYINVYTFMYKTLMYCGGGAFKGEF